jgi:hypothetical protein
LVYWNVRRIDHHYHDAVYYLNKYFDSTFIGYNKFKNNIGIEQVNSKDYDMFIAYDSGSQTFNLNGNRYDSRIDDIVGIPRILRTIDSHLRPEEHAKMSDRYDLVLHSSPVHSSYMVNTPCKLLPLHTNIDLYSVDKASHFNFETIYNAVGKEFYPPEFIFERLKDRYIKASFLIKFRDARAQRASSIFDSLPRSSGKCIIAKAMKYAATYVHSRSQLSLHLKSHKFDNYMAWRPLDAMACGATPVIERGND